MDEIHHAILRGDIATVRSLVDAEPDRLHLADFDARTPLILSTLSGSLALVEYFVEGPARAEVDEVRAYAYVRSIGSNWYPVLWWTDPLPKTNKNQSKTRQAIPPDGCSALFYACRDGRVDIARFLLAKGALVSR